MTLIKPMTMIELIKSMRLIKLKNLCLLFLFRKNKACVLLRHVNFFFIERYKK